MRPEAKARDIPPDSKNPPVPRRGSAVGPSGARRHIEARFAPLGPARADNDDRPNALRRLRPPTGTAHRLLPTSLTLLVRAGGLVVVVAAVLLALRPVSKIVRTSAPATQPAHIRVISSAGDPGAAAARRPKRQARLPDAAAPVPVPVPAPTATPAVPATHALAFAPEPPAPTSPALIATVRAVPVFAPGKADAAPAAAVPPG
jgi:hypothetical protein